MSNRRWDSSQDLLSSLPNQTRFPWLFTSILAKAGRATALIRFSRSLEVLPGMGLKNNMLLLMPSRKPERCRLTEIPIVLRLKPFLLLRRAFPGRSIWNEAMCTILRFLAGTALALLRLFWIASFLTVGFGRNSVPVWNFCHLNFSRTLASMCWTSEIFQVPQIFLLKRKPK